MDLSLFYAIHSWAGFSGWGDWLIVFFAQWYLYAILLAFAYDAWRDYKGELRNLYPYAAALLAALIARFGVAEIIRHFYMHARPFVALGTSHLVTDTSSSFPSGHTIFVFALAAAVYFFNKRLALFLGVSGLIIGVARVAAGVHYPSDILGGIVLGLITGVAVYFAAVKLFTYIRR